MAFDIKSFAKGYIRSVNKATVIFENGDNDVRMVLQYNPSSISINAAGGGGNRRLVNGDLTNYGVLSPQMFMSFQTIFDRTNNTHVFAVDKATLNASRIANAALNLGEKKIFSDEEAEKYTVRPIVEGVLATLRRGGKMKVVFEWGEQNYAGILNRVNARYTLFGPMGNPVRAEMNISITLVSTETNELSYFWAQKYEKAMAKLMENGSIKNMAASGSDESSLKGNLGGLSEIMPSILNL